MNIVQEAKETISLHSQTEEAWQKVEKNREAGEEWYMKPVHMLPRGKTNAELIHLISRLVDMVDCSAWELVKTKDCGCEIRKSNKGHYFTDSCKMCTNFPPELYIHAALPPVGDT